MTAKSVLKADVKKLKKRVRRLRKLVKIGVKTLSEKDHKIAQLTSVLNDGHHRKKSA